MAQRQRKLREIERGRKRMAQRESSFAKVQDGAVEATESGKEEEVEVIFTAPAENPFGLLPEEDSGDVEEFIEAVAVVAKKAEEEEKKQRQERKAEAKFLQQQQQKEQDQELTASVRAKRPIVPKWIYRSQIVFRKPKPEDQEQQEYVGVGDREHGKNFPAGGKGLGNNYIDRRINSGNNGFQGRGRRANGHVHGEGYQNQKIVDHQQEGNYQENFSRNNYQFNNGEERRNNHRHGYYKGDNNGYRGRYVGDQRSNDQKRNYRRGNYVDQRNINDQDYQRSSRGKGGQSQQWRLVRTGNMNSGDHDGPDQNQENGKSIDDTSERKGLDAVEHGVNGDKESSSVSENAEGGKAENSMNKKKNEKTKEKSSGKKSQVEPKNTMTYKEYQKVLLEKMKDLEARLNAGNFEAMEHNKGGKVGSSKTNSENELSKKEVAVKKKVSKSVSINEFLKPAEGTTRSTTSFNGHNGLAAGERSNAGHGNKGGNVNCGGHGYQGNYRPNNGSGCNGRGYHQDQGERTDSGSGGRGGRGGGRGFSGRQPAGTRPEKMVVSPNVEDIVQFPALGETPK